MADVLTETCTAEAAALFKEIERRIDLFAEKRIAEYVERARGREEWPTLRDIASLSWHVSRALRIFGFDSRTEIALERVRQLTGIDIDQFGNNRPSPAHLGRDLAAWFAPGRPVGKTPAPIPVGQAAYNIQMEALTHLSQVVSAVLEQAPSTTAEAAGHVREAVQEHTDFWLKPTYTRSRQDGYVRCFDCGTELTHLNTAEVGDIDDCIPCRGWFTSEQRKKQKRSQAN